MISNFRLLIVSPHKLFRESITTLLTTSGRFEARAGDLIAAEVLAELDAWRPAVLLVDLGPSSQRRASLELVRRVLHEKSGVKVMLTGVGELDPDVLRCLEWGASGYAPKDSTLDDLRRAVQLVVGGGAACPPRLTYSLFERLGRLSRDDERNERSKALKLTARELEILQLIAEGFSNQRIADQLCLSIYTVKNHVHHILGKLGVRRRTEAVMHAVERRWFRPERFPLTVPSAAAHESRA